MSAVLLIFSDSLPVPQYDSQIFRYSSIYLRIMTLYKITDNAENEIGNLDRTSEEL